MFSTDINPTDKSDAILTFIKAKRWLEGHIDCRFLAAGEYNENYLLKSGGQRYLFRINHGTQLNLDNQIEYEFNVLRAVEASGVTPRPYHYSLHSEQLGRGVMLMEFLPGRPLDYQTDLNRAAEIFARIHALPVPDEGLVLQRDPLEDLCVESLALLQRYPVVHYPEVYRLLRDYHDDLNRDHGGGQAIFNDESLCIVNSEVNSGNFIIDDDRAYLVDWEKAVVSCRYQDLAHFLVATTTLWKTEHRLTRQQKSDFLRTYLDCLPTPLDFELVCQRTLLLERIILLRALSWCFMAFHEYAGQGRALQHRKTLQTITTYLNDAACFLK